jgi:hypothetical protein
VSFDVKESALVESSAAIAGLTPAISSAETYLNEHVTLSGFGDSGIFMQATGVLDDVRASIQDELRHLRALLSSSAAELAATAELYRTTDDQARTAMDRLYYTAGALRGTPGKQIPR